MVSKHVKSFLIIPMISPLVLLWRLNQADSSFDYSQIFVWLFLIIPNYSFCPHNRSRSNGHLLGNQLQQPRAVACRGPEDHCHLRFRIGQQTPGRWWKERVVFCCLCLSVVQLGIRRIIRITVIINIIGIIEIISKILPERQALPRHQTPPTSPYRALHDCPLLIPRCHRLIQCSCSSPHTPQN